MSVLQHAPPRPCSTSTAPSIARQPPGFLSRHLAWPLLSQQCSRQPVTLALWPCSHLELLWHAPPRRTVSSRCLPRDAAVSYSSDATRVSSMPAGLVAADQSVQVPVLPHMQDLHQLYVNTHHHQQHQQHHYHHQRQQQQHPQSPQQQPNQQQALRVVLQPGATATSPYGVATDQEQRQQQKQQQKQQQVHVAPAHLQDQHEHGSCDSIHVGHNPRTAGTPQHDAPSSPSSSSNGHTRCTSEEGLLGGPGSSKQGTGSQGRVDQHTLTHMARHISTRIKQCRTWQQVDAVLGEYGPAFNVIHISAAITHLAQLQQQQQQGLVAAGGVSGSSTLQAQGWQQQQVQAHHPTGHPTDQQHIWGLDRLTHQMEQQHQQVQQQAALAHTQALAGSRLQHTHSTSVTPAAAAAAHTAGRSQQQHRLVTRLCLMASAVVPSAGARQVANMLWALSVLVTPSASSSSGSSTDSGISSSRPEPVVASCVQLLMRRAAEVFADAEAQHLSSMAMSATKLQVVHQHPSWLQQLLAAWNSLVKQHQQQHTGSSSSAAVEAGGAAPHLIPSSSTEVAPVGVSAARHQAGAAAPPLVLSSSSSSSSSPQATCNLLWSLVQLQQQPGQQWLSEVVAAAAPHLMTWPGKSVAMFMWGCARLGYSLRDTSIQQQQHADCLVDALRHHCQDLSTRDLAQALWSAAVMGLKLPPATLLLLLSTDSSKQLSRKQQPPPGGLSGGLQQQQQVVPSRSVAHSVAVVLWSVGQLQGLRHPLPPQAFHPWLAALHTHAAAADGQTLGVAAWGAGQLELTAANPQLTLHLLRTAALRQQQQQQCSPGSSSSSYVGVSQASAVHEEFPAAAAVAVLWAAGRCVVQQQQQLRTHAGAHQQQQQQQQQHPHNSTSPQSAAHHAQQRRSVLSPMTQAIRTTATSLCIDLRVTWAQQQQQQQQEEVSGAAGGGVCVQVGLWQCALVLWVAAVMQLRLPPAWWRDQLDLVLCLNNHQQQQVGQQQQQQQQQQDQVGQQQQQQQQGTLYTGLGASPPDAVNTEQQQSTGPGCQDAQALAVCVWALGRSQVILPPSGVQQLQAASLAFLQQQQLSHKGCVLLLLGFTRMATAAAAHLPVQSQPQRTRGVTHRHQKQLRHRSHTRSHMRQQHRVTHAQAEQQQQQGRQQGGNVSAAGPIGAGQLVRRGHAARQAPRWRVLKQQQQRHAWVAATGVHAWWLRAWCVHTQALLAHMGADSLVGVMWALGRLRWHPGGPFMAAAEARLHQLLPALGPRHLALLLWACGRLRQVPPAPLLEALVHAWEMQLAAARQVDTQQVAWAQQQLQALARAQGAAGG